VDSRRLDLPRTRLVPSASFANEVAATVNVDADLAERVRLELASGRMPVVISADCISCLGTLGGLMAGVDVRAERIGVVWLDAHGDFNTAATSPTGYLDAWRWPRRWAGVGDGRGRHSGFPAIDPANAIHLGGRDFDQASRAPRGGGRACRSPSELKTVDRKA